MARLGGTVDISSKDVTLRRAVAESALTASAEVVQSIKTDNLPKKDALGVARAAGLLAVKQTPALIPHCHPISLTGIDFEFRFDEDSVIVRCEVAARDRTGPEMEALCGASIAALTLYDMIKGIFKGARITRTMLIEKEGGKSGLWRSGDADG